MTWLGYIWRGIVETFYLLVVLAVFVSTTNRLEMVILSVLGMIYCTIRTIAIGNAIGSLRKAVASDHQFSVLRALILNEPEPLFEAEPELIRPAIYKLYISGVFIFFVNIVCIWNFFTAK